MKVARFSHVRPLLTVTEILSSGGGGPDGQVPTANGSNGVAWGSNVAIITSNTSNALTGPFVNFQSGSGIAFAADRKSTRLNSSHVETAYAVFCLKTNRSN